MDVNGSRCSMPSCHPRAQWRTARFMTRLKLAGVAMAGLLFGACGPVDEEVEPGIAEVLQLKASTPRTPDLTEPDTVSQLGMVGSLGSALGSPVAIHSTCSSSNDWRTTCGSGSSRDISYVWIVPATGAYNFNTRNSDFDTVLEIRNYRATSEVLACNDDTATSTHSSSTLNSLIRGTRLLITIEGYEGACGTAHLNIVKR
jgi:hypothetical protein